MTRRERLEVKAQKRREWAAKRSAAAEAATRRALELARIVDGQPILIGHHSEKRARRDARRIHDGFARGAEHAAMSEHHQRAAAGLERQLERSIYSDDDDAAEALEARAVELERERDAAKALQAAWRKAGRPEASDSAAWGRIAEALGRSPASLEGARRLMLHDFTNRGPCPPYVLTNLGARIRTARARVAEVQQRAQRAAASRLPAEAIAALGGRA